MIRTEIQKIIFFILLVIASEISGTPIPKGKQCSQPLWKVTGNHYAPAEICDHHFRDASESKMIRQKVFNLLTADGKITDYRAVNEFLDVLMTIVASPRNSVVDDVMCVGCSSGVSTYRLLREENSLEKILEIFKNICVTVNVMSEKICSGILDSYGNVLTTIVDSTNKTSDEICNFLLNVQCGSGATKWSITLPSNKKPPVTKPTPLPDNVKNLKVLHITDTHWDTNYVEGTWAECRSPLCCRKGEVPINNQSSKAGKYGGWKCDLPEITFDDMLKHINKQHPDLDYILWTGDIPAHDIWEQDKNSNLEILKKTAKKLRDAFPDTPLFPALGNHESIPPNMFRVPGNDTKGNPMAWLYDELDVQWNKWLNKNVSETVQLGAYYTTLIRPGFRIVSLNMNYCYSLNWWLILNSVDPTQELQWLVNLLQESETKKEKVHIIGHISPGSADCLKIWQTNYYKIIQRYESTVSAQFFGHSHNDQFELYYDLEKTSRVFGVGYVGPSVTTYTYLNPSYRIYYVEGDAENSRRFVVDHETWHFDLEEANLKNEIKWEKMYSAKEAYNMTSLYPTDWDKLYQQMLKSKDTVELYNKFYWSDSRKRPPCNDDCRKKLLCEIRSCAQYGVPK